MQQLSVSKLILTKHLYFLPQTHSLSDYVLLMVSNYQVSSSYQKERKKEQQLLQHSCSYERQYYWKERERERGADRKTKLRMNLWRHKCKVAIISTLLTKHNKTIITFVCTVNLTLSRSLRESLMSTIRDVSVKSTVSDRPCGMTGCQMTWHSNNISFITLFLCSDISQFSHLMNKTVLFSCYSYYNISLSCSTLTSHCLCHSITYQQGFSVKLMVT